MKRKLLLLAAICACGLSSAQAQTKKQNEISRAEKTIRLDGPWELTSMKGENIATLYPEKKPIVSISAPYGKINGFTGCNHFFGQVKVEGTMITFTSQLNTTKMACKGEGETKFLENMKQVTGYKMSDSSKFSLVGKTGVLMEFRKKPRVPHDNKQTKAGE